MRLVALFCAVVVLMLASSGCMTFRNAEALGALGNVLGSADGELSGRPSKKGK